MPVNINLLSDEAIARGVAPPDIGNFGTAFAGTQDYLQRQREQNLFSGGLPRTPEGDVDYRQVAEMLARTQGAGAIGSLAGLRQGDIQQQVLKGIGQGGGGVFSPPPLPQEQPRVPSIQRSGGLPVEPQQTLALDPDTGERRLRPDQPGNLGEVTGVSVDGQPTETPTARSFAPVASTDSRYPQQFQPPTERFTPQAPPQQMAQAPQAAPQRPQMQDVPPAPTQPLIPPGSPGFYSLENAANYEQMAGRAAKISAILGASGMAAAAAGYKQQSDHLQDATKQIREHLGKIGEEREKSRLKQETILPEAVTKAQVDSIVESNKEAKTLAQAVPTTQNLFNQLNSKSGVFSGAWASEKLQLAKIAASVGFSADPRITPTETYQAEIGRRVGRTVKLFGSGTSITNQDREYAEKMEGGQIKLDENSMRRILELADRGARETIAEHNAKLDAMKGAYPKQYHGQLDLFRVKEPPAITGRTTGPKAPPSGALPPAPMSEEDRTNNQLYLTPSGKVMRWNRTTAGTGWTSP